MPMYLLRSLLLLLAVIVPYSLAAITPDTEKLEAAFLISQLENADADQAHLYIIFSRVGAGENAHFISHICIGSGDPVNRWDPSGLDFITTSGMNVGDDVYYVYEYTNWNSESIWKTLFAGNYTKKIKIGTVSKKYWNWNYNGLSTTSKQFDVEIDPRRGGGSIGSDHLQLAADQRGGSIYDSEIRDDIGALLALNQIVGEIKGGAYESTNIVAEIGRGIAQIPATIVDPVLDGVQKTARWVAAPIAGIPEGGSPISIGAGADYLTDLAGGNTRSGIATKSKQVGNFTAAVVLGKFAFGKSGVPYRYRGGASQRAAASSRQQVITGKPVPANYVEVWGELAAAERAQKLQAGLTKQQSGRVTIGAAAYYDSAGAVRIGVSSSEPGLYFRPSVRPLLNPWERIAGGTGHAEHKLINEFNPFAVGAGRPVCPTCQSEILSNGSTAVTPLK